MKLFEMDCTLIKITAVTGVSEFKGDDRDHGCSVTFERMFENTILDEFDPDLRTALYKVEDGKPKSTPAGQGEFAMPIEGVKLTARKAKTIQGPLKLNKVLDGWKIVYHRGATEASAIKANDVKFSDFTLVEACEGGSCLLRFKAYQKLPPELQGFVDHMAQTTVECTFAAPEDTQQELPAMKQKGQRGRPKKTADEKASDDPFAGSDLAQDNTKIESSSKKSPETTPASEQPAKGRAKRVPQPGDAWPFPTGNGTH
ncbi:DUF2815 family protein [Pararobbsia alpina]|uniref:hypothetical protein n=1 Tax=Pararobbsia alpina TaxID=621374 RepID=UPI0039A5FA1B